MKLAGRIACLVAILGLLTQFVVARSVFFPAEIDHEKVASACGNCAGETKGSHCPMEPLHDHCGSSCSHLLTAVFLSTDSFSTHCGKAVFQVSIIQERVPEGFPSGLFIPPRLS